MQILLCKHSINNVTNLHNFEATGISINYYNSPRTVSVKVLTLPVVTEQTLPAIRDLKHVTNSDKKCIWQCQLEVATQRDCLQERFCFACT